MTQPGNKNPLILNKTSLRVLNEIEVADIGSGVAQVTGQCTHWSGLISCFRQTQTICGSA